MAQCCGEPSPTPTENHFERGGLRLRSWVDIAFSRPVVLRALRYAVVVGALLIAINHGDAILRGDLSLARLLRMLLTTLVPYAVSTLSSVEAARDSDQPEELS
jgi:hypothetical protein